MKDRKTLGFKIRGRTKKSLRNYISTKRKRRSRLLSKKRDLP